ncbi:MAG TPA: dethiobiotin synthase [Nitrosopumilaceae archaeon]|nr:dethiobiotin synthase [Nitrosopumilaceae archaeon]
MKSYFITGTDTDVGKTFVTAGLASSMKKMGINIGIMKPFAAGTIDNNGYKSNDVNLLSEAAQITDEEQLVNPYFFPIQASPFTAMQNLSVSIDVEIVLNNFKKLAGLHDALLVEGIGGIMTPILKNYFVTNLIKEMNLETIVVTSSRIGTINHTIMTIKMCQEFGINIRGIIINNVNLTGYPVNELKRDIEELTGNSVLGSIPYSKNWNLDNISEIISNKINVKSLLEE